MTRAGLLAPAAQAQPAQLATGACAEGGLLGAVEPLAVAILGVCRAVRLALPVMVKGLRHGQSRPHL